MRIALWTALVAASAQPVTAQETADWNEAHVLELVSRARAKRASVVVDSTFWSYTAEARGHVYFFLDRPDQVERTLVKADQVALDIAWRAPNLTRQRIVGLRDEKVLPTNVRYHLDHLTVVQDDFGDFIRLGDGDEVEQVLHPLGPDSEGAYDFQLSDSLTIQYAAGAEEIRVYEVRVRPKNLDQEGFVGTIFLDRSTAAVVRMNFSFTPASYVDPYLDYIRISLDNSLWMGRHWLPYRQEIELRREMPVLDFLAGSIIRGRFEIRAYDFNVEVPRINSVGRNVTSVSISEREAFSFDRGLFDDLDEDGLAPSPTMEEVREQVQEVVEDKYLGGLSPMRLYLGAMSDAIRYNRAEGIFVGAGITFRPVGDLFVRTSLGYGIGRSEASGSIALSRGEQGMLGPAVEVYWDELRDMGGHPGASRFENTITAASGERDYLDPFFARGAALTLGSRGTGPTLTLRWEEHQSARDVVSEGPDSEFRPVRAVDDGSVGQVEISVPLGLPGGGRGSLMGGVGKMESNTFASLNGELTWELRDRESGFLTELSASAGAVTGQAPAQFLHLIGGRMTLPGHPYRAFEGDRYWLASIAGTLPVWTPWLGIRLFATTGATYLSDRALPAEWASQDSDGIRASVGAGLSVGWDMFRFDVARGLDGGNWEAVFWVTPALASWL